MVQQDKYVLPRHSLLYDIETIDIIVQLISLYSPIVEQSWSIQMEIEIIFFDII